MVAIDGLRRITARYRDVMKPNLAFAFAVATLAVPAAASTAHAQTAPRPARAFVEGGLGYGWALSTADFVEVDNGTRYHGPSASGVALDLTGGVRVAPGLFVVADVAWGQARTIEGVNQDGDTDRTKVSHVSLSVGARTALPVGPGRLYAQMSLGLVTPFDAVRTQEMANGESRTTTVGYNTGTGGRAEMGYQVDVASKVYLGAGLRLETFATDNVGRTRVRVDQPSGNTETDTFTTDPDAGNNTRRAQALSLQDVRFRLDVGVRF